MRAAVWKSEVAAQWGRVGVFRVVVSPCVLHHLTDKLIDSFRSYNCSSSARRLPVSTHGGQNPQR